MAIFTNYLKGCYTWKSDSEQFKHLHKSNTYNNECISIHIKTIMNNLNKLYTHMIKNCSKEKKSLYTYKLVQKLVLMVNASSEVQDVLELIFLEQELL